MLISCSIEFIKRVEEKRLKARLAEFLSLFRNGKFNNTGKKMLDSIYNITLDCFGISFLAGKIKILSLCMQRCYGPHVIKLPKSVNH